MVFLFEPDSGILASYGGRIPAFLIQVASWYGLIARAGTPGSVMARLTKEVREIMKSDAMKKRYDDIGAYTVGSSPEEFEVYIRSETAKWQGLIKKVGIQPQ